MSDLISRQEAIDALWKALYEYEDKTEKQFQESEDLDVGDWIGHRIFVQNMNDIDRQTILNLPSAQPDVPDTNVGDLISRQAAISHVDDVPYIKEHPNVGLLWKAWIESLPSAQPEQRYTEEELRVFQHGISLSLLSKRSAQHWHYDEDTATEIKFLERLYDKVVADMGDEQDG